MEDGKAEGRERSFDLVFRSVSHRNNNNDDQCVFGLMPRQQSLMHCIKVGPFRKLGITVHISYRQILL